MRPNVSVVRTLSYKVSQFLAPILKPLTSNEFTTKNESDSLCVF